MIKFITSKAAVNFNANDTGKVLFSVNEKVRFSVSDILVVDGYPDGACSDLLLSDVTATSIRLDWVNGSTNETGISIERSLNGVDFTEIHVTAAGVEFYVDEGLDSGVQYWYRVRAERSGYYSAYTDIEDATTESGIEAETTALVSRFDVAPSAALLALINTTIKGLKDDGVFAKINVGWLFGLHTPISSIQNIRRNDNNGTLFNSPTHTPKIGFTGDGATSYIALDFIPSQDAIEMQLGNESILFMSPQLGISDTRVIFGCQKTAAPISVFNLYYKVANFELMYLQSDGGTNNNINIGAGEYIGYIRSGTNVQGYKNGMASGSVDVVNQAALTPFQMTALCNSVNNTRSAFYDGSLALLVIGGGWTATDMANITARFKFFYDNIGSTF